MSAVAKLQPKGSLASKFAERFNVDEAEVKNILKATAFKVKEGTVSDEQMSSLMIIANEYNLNPFTREIYAYPDKGGIVPVVGVDGWTRIMNEHPQFDGVEFKFSEETVTHKGKNCHVWIECIITRKDRTKPTIVREYFDEVVRTPNFTTPWETHPKRMHRHKTLIQCARVAFGFCGIYDEDEAERIMEKDITDQGSHEKVEATPSPKPALDDATFNEIAKKYKNLVESGKKTLDEFVAWVDGKGANMTASQIETVKSWVPKQPNVIEGEATQVDDPFVTAMNQAEGNSNASSN